ncbi:MAG: hypothetical protein WBE76_01355, partial [Terracidiphilus sp.]
ASAMLREFDFIPGDWAALLWALGSAAAIARHAGRGWLNLFKSPQANQEKTMNPTGKRAIGFASGAISALLLALTAFGLMFLADYLFPQLGIARKEWTHFLIAIVMPEAIFIIAAVALWRRRKPVAMGILLTAAAIGLHVAIHVAAH